MKQCTYKQEKKKDNVVLFSSFEYGNPLRMCLGGFYGNQSCSLNLTMQSWTSSSLKVDHRKLLASCTQPRIMPALHKLCKSMKLQTKVFQ